VRSTRHTINLSHSQLVSCDELVMWWVDWQSYWTDIVLNGFPYCVTWHATGLSFSISSVYDYVNHIDFWLCLHIGNPTYNHSLHVGKSYPHPITKTKHPNPTAHPNPNPNPTHPTNPDGVRTLQTRDRSDPSHLGTCAELSVMHIGTGAEVSRQSAPTCYRY